MNEWTLEEKNNFEGRYIAANAKQAIRIQELEAKLEGLQNLVIAKSKVIQDYRDEVHQLEAKLKAADEVISESVCRDYDGRYEKALEHYKSLKP